VVPEVLVFHGTEDKGGAGGRGSTPAKGSSIVWYRQWNEDHDIYVDLAATAVEVPEIEAELPDLSGTAMIAHSADTRVAVSWTTEQYSDVEPDSPKEMVVEEPENRTTTNQNRSSSRRH